MEALKKVQNIGVWPNRGEGSIALKTKPIFWNVQNIYKKILFCPQYISISVQMNIDMKQTTMNYHLSCTLMKPCDFGPSCSNMMSFMYNIYKYIFLIGDINKHYSALRH